MSALLERNPDISVIIPCYNLEQYITPMLNSLMRQDLGDYAAEIIFVINNCTDNTRSEVERFCADFPAVNLHYHVETNQGLSHARNRGIKEHLQRCNHEILKVQKKCNLKIENHGNEKEYLL